MDCITQLKQLRSQSWQQRPYEADQLDELIAALQGPDDHQGWSALSQFRWGYVREVAVRALGQRPSAQALAALLLRLNDWVPQVRQLAAAAVEPYLRREYVGLLLQALGPLIALGDKQRVDHLATLTAARAVLQAPEVRAEVEAAFVSLQGKPARFLFGLLHEATAQPEVLIRRSLVHRDMMVRQLAVEACAALTLEQAVPLLEFALHTRGASVRVKALRRLLGLVQAPQAYLQRALLDDSAAMRCLARWAAPQWQVEARQVLLARLALPEPASRREWLGLAGLARELNEPAAEPLLCLALQSPLASVRLQALEALGERGLEQQLAALDDESDKVFTRAVELLREQPWRDLDEPLRQRLDAGWQGLPAQRRAALMTLWPRGYQLQYLLQRHARAGADQAYWLTCVQGWCRGRVTLADAHTPKALREALLQQLQTMEEAAELSPGTVSRLR